MGALVHDPLSRATVQQGENPEIAAILAEVCEVTEMGFAAVARVTEQRWIVCQILDTTGSGLDPGSEREVGTTICDEVRKTGKRIVIDDFQKHAEWRTHPTPILYGFRSYVCFPLHMEDGSFFGSLCAVDPEPRGLGPFAIDRLESYADRIAAVLSASTGVVADASRITFEPSPAPPVPAFLE